MPDRRPALPRLLLHVEGFALFVAANVLYFAVLEGGWGLYLVLFLAPDLAMLGYLAGPRVGSVCYNVLHTLGGPIALAGVAWWTAWPLGLLLALIWVAHIGIDRALGYGLKYPTAFKDTHLQRL